MLQSRLRTAGLATCSFALASTAVAQETCDTAMAVTDGTTMFDNTAAVDEGPDFACGSGDALDLWYSYVATAPGTLNVDTCGSTFDTRIELYADCMGDELACNDDSCSLQSEISTTVAAGDTIYIRVAGWGGATGMGVLNVDGPSINDECADANDLELNCAQAFDTTVATPSADPWACTGSMSNDLWFKIVATADGPLTATTCDMANYDTRLEVFEGACGALTSLDCNDDACSVQSEVNWMATMGAEYWVRVGGFGDTSMGQGDILVTDGSTPAVANDECDGAIDLLNAVPEPWDNTMATNSFCATDWSCGGTADSALDLWYSFTPVADGSVTVDTEGSMGDTRLAVYDGSCGELVQIDCDDDGGTGLLSSITFDATGGTTYYARVAGFGDGVIMDGMITATYADMVANDDCAGAIGVDLGLTMYSNFGATDSGVDMSCVTDGETSDVWFSFTAGANCPVTVDLSGSDYDTGMAIYTGDCTALTEVDCDDDGGDGLDSLITFNATAGTTYLIQVGGFNGASGDGVMTITEETGLGMLVCAGDPNSTGVGSSLKLFGSDVAADNDLTISITQLPVGSMGYVVTSMETNTVVNPDGSAGTICIASFTMGRFNSTVLTADADGTASFSPDLTMFPMATAPFVEAVMAGETRYFQHWHRDTVMGVATSNFSSAQGLTFN